MTRRRAASPGAARAPAGSAAPSEPELQPRAPAAPSRACASSRATRTTRRCTLEGCTSLARSRGLCKAHGGGKRCQVAGCGLSDQGGGCCIRHGGGKRCQVAGCHKSAQSRHFCKAHGGGVRCKVAGCGKSSQGGGCCRSHGGGPRRPPKTRTQKQKQKQRARLTLGQAHERHTAASASAESGEFDSSLAIKEEPRVSATESSYNRAVPLLSRPPGILDRRRNRSRGLLSPRTAPRQAAHTTTSPVIKTEAGARPGAARGAADTETDASYFRPANLLLTIQSLAPVACASSVSTPSTTADSPAGSLGWSSPASSASSDVHEAPVTTERGCSIGGCRKPVVRAALGESSSMCEQHRAHLALATSLLDMQDVAKGVA